MKWMRFKHGNRDAFGLVDGAWVQVHEGNLFDQPVPTSERIALDQIEWMTPCVPSKMIGLCSFLNSSN